MTPDKLLDTLYDQLRKQAQKAMKQERADHTLSATALVHEAYLRLGDSFANQAHFYASASDAMRRILIDHARARLAQKRGGADANHTRVHREKLLEMADLSAQTDPSEILALNEAVSRLEARDPQAGLLVRLRFFGGLTIEEAAAQIGISPRSAKRDWQFARAFLFRELSGDDASGTGSEKK